MEFQEVVRRRKMVRRYLDRAVPSAAIERIVGNAQRAPSAGFSQGWAFVVLEGPVETALFWDAIADEDWLAGRRDGVAAAPVIIVPLANKQAYLQRYREPDKAYAGMQDESAWPAPFWDIDVGMASMLMLLTAVDEGLGALFFGIPAGHDELRAALGYPPEYRPIGALAIGWPDPADQPSPSLKRGRRAAADVVHYGRW